ncbi:peptidoglycan-binding domain-containing protein [Methylobacterium planeticum]|uniref:peptidoglycan-binding domain-containing protein n=1 Tax=Methylobacterium planeticum TaxID=2615211 RepID=UPI0038996738
MDGIWDPSTSGALIALQTQAGIAPDGHWGPQSKAALDDDANRRRIDPARAATTAADLRAQGSVIAIQGSRVTWSSVWQIVLGAMGIFQYLATNWQGNLDGLPFPASLILGVLPPWVAPVLIILLNVYNALAAQGIVKARVVAERTGLHNGEPDPAPSPPVAMAPDGPRLGGLLGSLFGAR